MNLQGSLRNLRPGIEMEILGNGLGSGAFQMHSKTEYSIAR